MSTPSMLAAVCLLVATAVTVITLLREKPEVAPKSRWKRLLKPGLYLLAFATLAFGLFQLWASDVENHKNELKHEQERAIDQSKIDALKVENEQQYERHQQELKKVREELGNLKTDIATVELRKKIGVLQAQLDKSLAPKPKAKLDFSFYENNMKIGEVHKSKYIPVEGEVVPRPRIFLDTEL